MHIDLGCGDGTFLCALAQRMPEKNFLGVERLLGRVRSAARKAAKIDNVVCCAWKVFYVVRYLLPPASVETFYLMFPDPWPKRRHQRRRVMNEDFLDAIIAALVANGTLHIATDQLDYFEQIKEMARVNSKFVIVDPSLATTVGVADVDPAAAAALAEEALPLTKFEKNFENKARRFIGWSCEKFPR